MKTVAMKQLSKSIFGLPPALKGPKIMLVCIYYSAKSTAKGGTVYTAFVSLLVFPSVCFCSEASIRLNFGGRGWGSSKALIESKDQKTLKMANIACLSL